MKTKRLKDSGDVKAEITDLSVESKGSDQCQEQEDWQKENCQEGNKAEFLIVSGPMQECCPSFRKEQETVEQAECLKYMTEVI